MNQRDVVLEDVARLNANQQSKEVICSALEEMTIEFGERLSVFPDPPKESGGPGVRHKCILFKDGNVREGRFVCYIWRSKLAVPV